MRHVSRVFEASTTQHVTRHRYSSSDEALPHVQAIVLQEQEAAAARASRGEDAAADAAAAADGDADAAPSTASASVDTSVNVRCMPRHMSHVTCHMSHVTCHMPPCLCTSPKGQVAALVAVLKDAVAAVGAVAAAPEASTCSLKQSDGKAVPQVAT